MLLPVEQRRPNPSRDAGAGETQGRERAVSRVVGILPRGSLALERGSVASGDERMQVA